MSSQHRKSPGWARAAGAVRSARARAAIIERSDGKGHDGDLATSSRTLQYPPPHMIYYETEWLRPPELKPKLKNQWTRFPARGKHVRRTST